MAGTEDSGKSPGGSPQHEPGTRGQDANANRPKKGDQPDPRIEALKAYLDGEIRIIKSEIKRARVFRYIVDGLGGLATLGTTSSVACNTYGDKSAFTMALSMICAICTGLYGYFRSQTTGPQEIRILSRTLDRLATERRELPIKWMENEQKFKNDKESFDDAYRKTSEQIRHLVKTELRKMRTDIDSMREET